MSTAFETSNLRMASVLRVSRKVFARGVRGAIIRSVQQELNAAGCYTGIVDGFYGGGTERAVSSFQLDARLPDTGGIDSATWTALMRRPIPSIFERALQLTAAFEGHGFGMVQGNWDGAWLTWGILGFTLRYGEIQKLLLTIDAAYPKSLRLAFGSSTPKLLKVLRSEPAAQEAWANSISDGARVREPWRTGFQRLGFQPGVQLLQIQRARATYFESALKTAGRFELVSEQGIALCFDIHVQNGGINKVAAAAIRRQRFATETARRIAIANAVADAARPAFRADVRARKLAIATGIGSVHGESFVTDRWGIGEYLAADSADDAD